MKKGSNVKVTADCAFTGQEGQIEQYREGLLPIGVRLKAKGRQQGVLLWCHEKELEWMP